MAKKKAKEPFIITEEMVEKATAYIPLADKVAFAVVTAQECIEPVEIDVLNIQANETMALPSLYQEDTFKKQLYLMQAFLKDYLHIAVPDEFTAEVYDEYAKDQPLNQLERLKTKGSPAIKDKVFDLLADYKALKKLLDREIYKLVTARNSTLDRFLASVTLFSSPENVQPLVKELQQTVQETETAQKKLADKRATAKKVELAEKK